jgi:hypothetical protein
MRVMCLIRRGSLASAAACLLNSASGKPSSANASPDKSFDVSETPPKSQPLLDLKVEDFERLGVRPDEMRLTVIRRAATQTSRTLAQSQLTNPSETAALQLSRVTVSAYRLLDPRLRGDVHQRIHVGRILPTVLMWAGQTKFQNQQTLGRRARASGVGVSEVAQSDDADANMPFQGGGLSESDLIELMELDSTPLLAGQPAWAQSLSDVDILGRTNFLRRWNRWKRVLLSRWYSIGLVVILIVLFLAALFVVPARDKALMNDEVDLSSSVRSGDLNSATSQDDVANRLIEPDIPIDQIVGLEQGLGRLDERDLGFAEMLESDIQGEKTTITDESMMGTIVDLENPVVDLSVSNLPASKGDATTKADSPVVENSASEFLPDPFASSAETAMEPENLGVDPESDPEPKASLANVQQGEMLDQPELGKKPEGAPKTFPETKKRRVPDSEAVADARNDIVSRDSISLASGNKDDLVQRLVALEEIKESLQLGTPEYWAVSLLLIESAWQTEGVSDVNRNLVDLQQLYQFEPEPFLVETYLQANARSALPEIQKYLLANGFVLLDQLLIADQVELAIRILDSVESLASTLRDTESLEYVAAYERVISQAMRQRERFARLLLEDPGTWSQSTRGLLGRHYCLVLRRWEVGLPWLSSASDSRIASAAKAELALPENPAFEDLLIVARLWDINAGRASGLNRDAMRLHAVFLAGKAMEQASESQRLEFGMELRELSEALPEHLRNEGFQLQ